MSPKEWILLDLIFKPKFKSQLKKNVSMAFFIILEKGNFH